MERQTIKRHTEKYINEVKLAVRHPLLERDVGEVQIDAAKVFFLLLPMLNGERWTKSINTAAVAVGAVHAAFDAHDTINATDATTTRQQLTVLSGDFFSGIHYKLLASIPDFAFIRSLSRTIGQINELKTNFHDRSPSSTEQFLEAVRVVQAGCTIQFLHTYGYSQYVPVVAAALPLLAMDPEVNTTTRRIDPVSLRLSVNSVDFEHVLTELRMELQEAIDTAYFIAPFLKEEIRGMTVPLLGKPI